MPLQDTLPECHPPQIHLPSRPCDGPGRKRFAPFKARETDSCHVPLKPTISCRSILPNEIANDSIETLLLVNTTNLLKGHREILDT